MARKHVENATFSLGHVNVNESTKRKLRHNFQSFKSQQGQALGMIEVSDLSLPFWPGSGDQGKLRNTGRVK